MIKIEVENYCQTCLHFEPEVTDRPVLWYAEKVVYEVSGDTIIKCKYRRNCEFAVSEYKKGEPDA